MHVDSEKWLGYNEEATYKNRKTTAIIAIEPAVKAPFV